MAFTNSITPSDISFILQIIALILLIVGINRLKDSVSKHGDIIKIPFILLVITGIFMIFSALNVFDLWLQGISLPFFLILIPIHGFFGAITLILGFLFVMNKWSWKTKKNMRIEFVLWIITFAGGTLLYLIGSGIINVG